MLFLTYPLISLRQVIRFELFEIDSKKNKSRFESKATPSDGNGTFCYQTNVRADPI
jgi:hypothetical protein